MTVREKNVVFQYRRPPSFSPLFSLGVYDLLTSSLHSSADYQALLDFSKNRSYHDKGINPPPLSQNVKVRSHYAFLAFLFVIWAILCVSRNMP